LVSRADIQRFTEILYRLGFKQAKAPVEKQMPGVQDYFGYDEAGDKWVHVHAHYQLILGDDMTKNFHLAIEEPYLRSAMQGDLFKVPSAEFEYIVLVIRMVLKHAALDAILTRQGSLKSSERRELDDLQDKVDSSRSNEILKHDLSMLSSELFVDCERALQSGCPIWSRAIAAHRLQVALKASAFHSLPVDIYLKLWRRIILVLQRRLFKTSTKYQSAIGGALIAFVGGDGAGKSTAINALHTWLSKNFQSIKVHMGKPNWSWITKIIRSMLKIGQILGLYPLETSFEETLTESGFPRVSLSDPRGLSARPLLEVCESSTFRCSWWNSFFSTGFTDPIHLMDGPQTERFIHELADGPGAKLPLSPKMTDRFAQYLVRLEKNFYHQISFPDLVAVLRIEPEIAVQRKTEEDPSAVFQRSNEIWQIDWDQTGVYVIDSSLSKAEVVSELRGLIWSKL
jgi:thymidylate kinase